MINMEKWVTLVAVVGVIALFFAPGTHQEKLTTAVGYGTLLLVFLFGAMVLTQMANGNINLKDLLEEESGGASTSRFQLLIFTFVIALSFFLLVAKNGELPKISGEVLTLLGISGTTYAVGKGIQAGSPQAGGQPGAGANQGGNQGASQG